MRHIAWIAVLVVTSAPAALFAGDVQILCGPGLEVYLDGQHVGTSNEKEDGLFLAAVREGRHTIRVAREGFVARSYEVEVGSGPIEVKVERLEPQLVPAGAPESRPAETPTRAATLIVTSAPQICWVEVDGRTLEKTMPEMTIDDVGAGEHLIVFSRPGYKSVSKIVTLPKGAELTVRGDLIAGKVETVFEGKGSLRLYSQPEHCMVRIAGKAREKIRAVLNMSHLPAGEHRLVVSWKTRTVSRDILIMKGYRTIVSVKMVGTAEPFTVSYEPE